MNIEDKFDREKEVMVRVLTECARDYVLASKTKEEKEQADLRARQILGFLFGDRKFKKYYALYTKIITKYESET